VRKNSREQEIEQAERTKNSRGGGRSRDGEADSPTTQRIRLGTLGLVNGKTKNKKKKKKGGKE
jgi:hypothetical protein